MWLILIIWWISIHHHFPHAYGHEFGYTMIYPISVSRPDTGCWPSVIADATLHRHFTQYHKLGSTLILKRWVERVEPCDATYLGVVEQHCGISPLWERLGFVSKAWGRGKWWIFGKGSKFETIHLFIVTLENGRDYDHDVGNHWHVCVCVTIVFRSLALWKSCGKYTLNAHIKLWQQTELPLSVCMFYDATGNVSFRFMIPRTGQFCFCFLPTWHPLLFNKEVTPLLHSTWHRTHHVQAAIAETL